jgi:hypothetical protein
MEEIWKTIDQSKNYQISNLGRFKNIKGKILSLNINARGYKYCNISRNGIISKVKIHRLVAQQFCKKPSEDCTFVNHIDGDQLNNCDWNLEWVTPKQNSIHYHKILKPKIKAGITPF